MAKKPTNSNTLLWRMNPRRLDVESYRDTLLRSAGRLDDKMYGPSDDVDTDTNVRRTVYGRVSRGRMSNLLQALRFPRPDADRGGRDLTTTSLQQLFVMNSAFMHDEAAALVKSVENQPDDSSEDAPRCTARSCRAIPVRRSWTWRSAI